MERGKKMNEKTKNSKFRKTKTYLLSLTSYLFKKQAQVMIEFTFCMIVLFLMMYASVMVFRWVGLDLGWRQEAHEELLKSAIDFQYGQCLNEIDVNGTLVCVDYRAVESGPLSQIDPYFYTPESMNAVWTGN